MLIVKLYNIIYKPKTVITKKFFFIILSKEIILIIIIQKIEHSKIYIKLYFYLIGTITNFNIFLSVVYLYSKAIETFDKVSQILYSLFS